jgi:hypothetical protein
VHAWSLPASIRTSKVLLQSGVFANMNQLGDLTALQVVNL